MRLENIRDLWVENIRRFLGLEILGIVGYMALKKLPVYV